ncbi:transcriptional regulator [Paractinoplanes deccanensis]|uniref:Transcriptional regulator n=1 Tax=Paractinoplanes deccanensis TaxID=113561 RepID=A0ABQ3YIJ4_9ACTN|nr:helix-turn-helix transcriptional regulator [Actinoplanes deccanensis]GID79823.1 transcriptional regulator [Actinoplanes deccanensis]
MARRRNAAVSRRRIRSKLRTLRSATQETQRDVADALDWSTAKLMRIEGGRVGISTTDLKALLAHYGVTDETELAQLAELARISRTSTLAATYGPALSKEFAEFIENEEAARIIRQFEPKLIPGPLQTEDYARAILTAYAEEYVSRQIIEQRVFARLARRDQILQTDGPEAFFIIDEAALWRWIGAESGHGTLHSSVMIRQLEDMLDVIKHPNVKVQFMPFRAGAYRAMGGPFVVLEFDEPSDDNLLYLENPEVSLLYYENAERTEPYLRYFQDMETKATPVDKAADAINAVLRTYREGGFGIPA